MIVQMIPSIKSNLEKSSYWRTQLFYGVVSLICNVISYDDKSREMLDCHIRDTEVVL
jgi:hypothetical protein